MLGHQGLLVPHDPGRLPVLGSKRARLPRVRLPLSPPHVLDCDLNLSDLNLPLATASI